MPPEKGSRPTHPLVTGGEKDPFLRHLQPLFSQAHEVVIVVAFVQEGGLKLLEREFFAALRRGARIKILTGDYLHITQAAALERLLDWSLASQAEGEDALFQGSLEARIFEVENPGAKARSFHPKSWRFASKEMAVAFVGSSNLSFTALTGGIEWNLRVERESQPEAYQRIVEAFEELWARATPLRADWVEEYGKRARLSPSPLPTGEEEAAPLLPPPDPHAIQKGALRALSQSRARGQQRALVVMATGLGKTWLAAFDVAAFRQERGRLPRVLFLAHRAELLAQAAATFRSLLRQSHPDARFAWFVGDQSQISGDVVLASVQKLSRAEHLSRLSPGAFDYVILDEVHHAAAPSYRRILERLSPAFLLGLTATPDRADEGDILGLFDDHLAYRADLGVGILHGLLAPFAYYGLKDEVDYSDVNIPWRNRRFDPEALARAVQTQARMERLFGAWEEYPGLRTLVFCCSIAHARFARDWLREQGVRAEAVHSEEDSFDRQEALRQLEEGKLDALCAVDLFNEGIDLPRVDRVVMLRPTESPVIFLQQLGRGLRKAEGKEKLTVIDFVGNHRIFLERIRLLLSFGERPTTLHKLLKEGASPELPPGCSLELELEAKDILQKLLPSGEGEAERMYRELYETRGQRPTAGELFRLGFSPNALRRRYPGWFDFVSSEGHLDALQTRVFQEARPWLDELETRKMPNCFQMVLLWALLEAEALLSGMSLSALAQRSHAILLRSPALLADVKESQKLTHPQKPDHGQRLSFWRENAAQGWLESEKKRGWFYLEKERLLPRLPVPQGAEDAFVEMTRELVDYRLAQYRASRAQIQTNNSFICRVTWNKRDPILKLPSRKALPELPLGDIDVRISDGSLWQFRFAKEYCNVAHPVGTPKNRLPDFLRQCFGPHAGHPGTAFQVKFSRSPDGWWIEPVGAEVIELPSRGVVRAYPSLRAAAGAATGAQEAPAEAEEVRLPFDANEERIFAVRASGDSMDGGVEPIRDGDWLVMRFARDLSLSALVGRVALFQIPGRYADFAYQVKRLVPSKGEGRWQLRSENPRRPSFEASEETAPIAVLQRIIRPEELGPPIGATLPEEEMANAFGLSRPLRTGRLDGHLFLCIEKEGSFMAPDRLVWSVPDLRPSETAFILTRPEGQKNWRYCGVARFLDKEKLWSLPELDFQTFRALGKGRDCSRRLSPAFLEEARAWIDAFLTRVKPGSWIEQGGRRFRLVGRSPKGGLRVDGGPKGFGERTVSLIDVAWVLLAREEVQASGGVLDEARVNRLRYLEGTPRGSTRWIDTGWAIRLIKLPNAP